MIEMLGVGHSGVTRSLTPVLWSIAATSLAYLSRRTARFVWQCAL